MKLDKAKREELRALEAKATRGPWKCDTDKYGDDFFDDNAIVDVFDESTTMLAHMDSGKKSTVDARDTQEWRDGQLIAAARNALPGLLDDLDDADRRIAALESVASAAREADGLLTAHGSTGTVLLRAMMKIREALRRLDGAGEGNKE